MTLPNNWHEMSLDALWETLNDPRRFPAPKVTVDLLVYALCQDGIAALDEPKTQRRLGHLWDDQVREVIERLAHLRPHYHAITDDILLAVAELIA